MEAPTAPPVIRIEERLRGSKDGSTAQRRSGWRQQRTSQSADRTAQRSSEDNDIVVQQPARYRRSARAILAQHIGAKPQGNGHAHVPEVSGKTRLQQDARIGRGQCAGLLDRACSPPILVLAWPGRCEWQEDA